MNCLLRSLLVDTGNCDKTIVILDFDLPLKSGDTQTPFRHAAYP